MQAEIISNTAVVDPHRRSLGAPTPLRRIWSINVLVVEDDAADATLILNVLRRHPNVSSAQAFDAPDMVLHQLAGGHLRPDLILLDLHMPRIDGFAFLRRLRRLSMYARTPVVFLTTSQLARDVLEAKHSTAASYVIKPNTYLELQERLAGVIDRAVSGSWSR